MLGDGDKENSETQTSPPSSIEIDVNSPPSNNTPALSGDINNNFQANILQIQPQDVNFVMGPDGQMIAIQKPPFLWKQFLIGGGIPFSIYFVPLLILMVGSGLGFDSEFYYKEVDITKEENSTMYFGEFKIGVEDGNYLNWCDFRTTDDQSVDIFCSPGNQNATILAPNWTGEAVGNWSNDNGTIYFDTGIDYGEKLILNYEYSTEPAEFFVIVADLVGITCCLGFLLSIILLVVGFSQGKPGMGWGGVAALAVFPFASIATLALLW